MTAGHLEVKNGKYFVVISYQDEYGKRHRKQFATGLPEKGSRRAAEAELSRIKKEFKPPHPALSGDLNPDMLFADYLIKWVEIAKMRIKLLRRAIAGGKAQHRHSLSRGHPCGAEIRLQDGYGGTECRYEGGKAPQKFLSARIP